MNMRLTAFPHAVSMDMAGGGFWLAFADEETLYIRMPKGAFTVSFRVLAGAGRVDRRGGRFVGDPEHRTIHRNVAYTTNAKILSNKMRKDGEGFHCVCMKVDSSEGSGWTLNITPRLGLNRSVLRAGSVLEKSERRWHSWFADVPKVESRYRKQYYYAWWILRAGLISPRFFVTREVMIPSKTQYIGAWQWDSFFHALAYRYVDRCLAENQLRIMLDHQLEDGMIPDAIHDEGVVTQMPLPGSGTVVPVTKPPLIAWTARLLYAVLNNRDFLSEIYESLKRWTGWWFERNDDDRDGIVQYNHPYSSGLDDSPLWDRGMPVESPDINTYLAMSLDAMADIAGILGYPEEGREWLRQADSLTERMISHFWDDRAGVFWATKDHRPLHVLTPVSLFPLLTGRLPKAMEDALIRHLFEKREFWTAFPIPSVAQNDPRYDPQTMWRGPTWVNINYLFIEGLERIGRFREARRLRTKTLDMVMQNNDVYEYYHPETGKNCPKAASVFGWSSAIFVDLAIRASRGGNELKRKKS